MREKMVKFKPAYIAYDAIINEAKNQCLIYNISTEKFYEIRDEVHKILMEKKGERIKK